MGTAPNERISTWVRSSSALFLAILAVGAYFLYVSNGIVVGALIGIPGREGDVATAQRYAMFWLAASSICQLGVVITIFSMLQFAADAPPLARYLTRGLIAVLMAFSVSILVGEVLWGAFQLLFP